MSKSSYLGANVEVTTDSFGGWIDKTNQVRNDMGTIVVTTGSVAQPNTTNGAETSGNAHVEGIFSATTLSAVDELRGGTVSVPATLDITSNVDFTSTNGTIDITSSINVLTVDANNVVVSSNVVFDGGATKIFLVDAANTVINTGSFYAKSNTYLSGTNTYITSTQLKTTSNTIITGARVDIDGTTLDVTSNTVFTAVSLNANVGLVTVGFDGEDDLVVNATSDFNANVNIDGILTQTANATFTGALVNITSANTTVGDAGTDKLNVNSTSDFNANATFSGALVNITSANTTVGDAETDKLNVNATSDFNAPVNIDGLFTVTNNSTFTGALVNITSANTNVGDAGTDKLNVNATSDFNANVNIDGILTQTANATFTGALVNITSANTTVGDAGTDQLNVNATSDFNAPVNIDGLFTVSNNSTFTGALVNITSANTTVGDASTDKLNVNATSDFNAPVNIDGILTQTNNATFSGALVNITSANTTVGDAETDKLNVNATSDFNAPVNIDGLFTVTNTATFTGAETYFNNNVTLGATTGDTVSILGYVDANILPSATTVDLGSDAKPFGNVHTTYVWSDNNIDTLGDFVVRGSTTRTLKALSTNTGYQTFNLVLETSTANQKLPLVANSTGIHGGANTVYDLGSTAINWNKIYVKDAAVANSAVVSNVLTVNTQANTASLMVRDLTATRIPYVGTGGEIVDSANLVFSGTTLAVTGNTTVSANLNVSGSANLYATYIVTQANTASLMVRDLTATRVPYIGTDGEIVDSANLVFSGTTLYMTQANTGSLMVLDLTVNRVPFVGTGGEIVDSANLVFSGTSLDVTGNTTVSANLTVTNEVSANTVVVTRNLSSDTLTTSGLATLNSLNVVNIATFNANLDLQDSDRLLIGTGDDLQLYHDGLNSYIKDAGTGALIVDASVLRVMNAANTESMIVASENGAVSLYYDNTLRFETSLTGANVTGTFGTSGQTTLNSANVINDFQVDGISTLAGNTAFGNNVVISGDLTVLGTTQIAADVEFIVNNSVSVTATTQDLTVTGNTVLGDTNADIITLNAKVVNSIIPSANNTYNIGSATEIYDTVYAENLVGNVAWSSVTSKPDPVVTVTLSGDVSGTGNATLTDLGNGTVSITTTVQPNSVALGTDTTGNYMSGVSAGGGITVTHTPGEGSSATIAHTDTSSVGNLAVDNSNGTVLQDLSLTFDTYGHVTAISSASINLDNRFSQNTFSTISVSGQSDVVADSRVDTLTLVGGGIASITTNATTDTITITATEVDTLHSVTTRGNTTTNNITVNDVNARNLVLSGNLTVSGTTTYVNTTNLNVGDNIVTLNADFTSATPTENAGIEIERGSVENNTLLIWNETTDRWTFTNNGTDYYNIPISTEYDKYTSWTILDGDTTTYTITSGDTLQVLGGTYITSNFTADDVLTISHDSTTRTNATSTSSPGYGGTFTAIDSITTNTQGHVTAVNTKTVTIPASDNTNTTYDLLAVANTATNAGLLRLSDSSTANDTVTFTGSGATVVSSNATHVIISSTDTNTTNLDYTSATTQGTVTSSTGTNAVIPAANSTFAGLVTTGDQTIAGTKTFSSTITGSISGNADTVTNGVYTTGDQTIAGTKTFSSTITGSISGNAATATSATSATSATYASDAGGLKVSSGGAFIIDGIAQTVPVNYLQVRAANTAQDVLVTTAGTDANIDLLIQTKGTGSIILDTGTGAGVIDLKPGTSNLRIWDNTSTHYHEVITGDPDANRTLTLPNANVTLVSGTMVPTTGTGASGSWGISVTGSSASCTGNAGTVTNGVYTTGTQTIAGTKTFSSTITGSISGNAGTVTNGVYQSGDQTIAGTKTFSSTITGSISGNAGTVTNGVYQSGDQTIAGTKTFSSNIVAPGITRTGDFTIDASGDIILDADGGQIYLKDAGTQRGYFDIATASTVKLYAGTTLNTTWVGANTIFEGAVFIENADSTSEGLKIANSAGEVIRFYFSDSAADARFNINYFNSGGNDIGIYNNGTVAIDWSTTAHTAYLLQTGGSIETSDRFIVGFNGAGNSGDILFGNNDGAKARLRTEDSGAMVLQSDPYNGFGSSEIRFEVDGTERGSIDASGNLVMTGNITANSDARLKENVVTVDSALDKVSQMRGVYFNKIGEEKRSLGVIAQEIEEVLPEVVLTADDEEGIKSVAYGNIVGVLIEAIKELKAEIETLRAYK